MSLDAYRRHDLLVLSPHATAFDAARAMAEHEVCLALVTEGGDLRGVVTDRDLALEVVGQGRAANEVRLEALLRTPVVTVDVGADPSEAARRMADSGCRRLPVTDDGVPVGVVSLDDLLLDCALGPVEIRAVIAAQRPGDRLPAHPEADEAKARRDRDRRHRARADATYQRLLRAVERNTGIGSHHRAERALGIVLGAVCRRLMPDEARHFVAQLPSKLHPELVECLDGPDKRIHVHTIVAELKRELSLDEPTALELLYAVCEAVADAVSAGEIDAVRGQLPAAMKELFPPIPYRRSG